MRRVPSFPLEAVPARRGIGASGPCGGAGAAMSALGALPLCDTWVANVSEMDAWVERAKPGDRFVYCIGPDIVRGLAAARAAELYREGLVELYQPAAETCRGRKFLMERRSTPTKAEQVDGQARAAVDPHAIAIYGALKAAADRGRRCPSNLALAREAGLPTAQAAAWRVTAMRDAGLFVIQTDPSGPDGPWRTIRFPTGRSTAPPPAKAASEGELYT
ncbi:MAG: hypothetical protein ACXWUJ_11445 [Allosphingosinicella sp.]